MSLKFGQYKAYSQAFQTVAKTKQIVMLYDGAIRFIKQAKEAIKENRIEDRYNLLVRVSEIILGLQGCIDFEKGGQIAHMLYNFYSAIDLRVSGIHRSNSVEECDAIIEELKGMRDAWEHIDADIAGAAADQSGASAQMGTVPHIPQDGASATGGITFSA